MDKKSYIISMLHRLQPYRPLAEGILALVEETQVTDKTLDSILDLLHQGIKQVQSQKGQESFQKAIELVQKIKYQSDVQQEKDETESEALLQQI
jgi:hypothetical protein